MVECAPGERLSLPPQLPNAPAAAAAASAALPRVDLWCLDNSMGTFLAATPQLPAPEPTFDLRSPLGLTPAALLAMGAAQEVSGSAPATSPGRPRTQEPEPAAPPATAAPGQQQRQQPGLRMQRDPSEMFRTFQSSQRELRGDAAACLVAPSGEPQPPLGRDCSAACRHVPSQAPTLPGWRSRAARRLPLPGMRLSCRPATRPARPAVVDFRRICVWEGDPACAPGSSGEACGVSIWRPVAPPGYAALGDCLVRGYDPPLSACVAQDTGARR